MAPAVVAVGQSAKRGLLAPLKSPPGDWIGSGRAQLLQLVLFEIVRHKSVNGKIVHSLDGRHDLLACGSACARAVMNALGAIRMRVAHSELLE